MTRSSPPLIPVRRSAPLKAGAFASVVIAALSGCGRQDAGEPQSIAFSVELGESFSSEQLANANYTPAPWRADQQPTPAYLPPYRPGAHQGDRTRPADPRPNPASATPRAESPNAEAPNPEAFEAEISDAVGFIDDQPTELQALPPEADEPQPASTETPTPDNPTDSPQWEDALEWWPSEPALDPPAESNPQASTGPQSSTSSTGGNHPLEVATINPLFGPPAPLDPPAPQAITATPADVEPIAPSIETAIDPLAADTLATETPAVAQINRLMLSPVREAFALGRSGAVYAARGKFEDALRQIANAKDAAAGDDRHLRALAEGLRALDEAQHFLPLGDSADGTLLDGGPDVMSVARGHRTPVLHDKTVLHTDEPDADPSTIRGAIGNKKRVLPQQAIARYHLHAAQRLAAAVEGEQAGSMALFGLGKAYARLADRSDDRLAGRRSLAMYRAAILAHDGNHLAANELGVGLAQTGHYQAAGRALARAASRGGGSTVYRNLARVQQRLGQTRLANASGQQAERLAARERTSGAFSRRLGVQWVSPQQFSRIAADAPAPPSLPATPPTHRSQNARASIAAAPPQQPSITVSPRGPWRVAAAAPRQPAVPARATPTAAAPPTAFPYTTPPYLGNQQAPPVKSQAITR